jgi:monoamine oxidase
MREENRRGRCNLRTTVTRRCSSATARARFAYANRAYQQLYFNAGPARIPSHHQAQASLNYWREFGVELQVEVNSNRSALFLNGTREPGTAASERQVINDTRGHVSELLVKAIKRGALDQEMTAADKERVVEVLRVYGDLSPDLFYKGSTRSGFRTLPGAGADAGVTRDPIDMRLLLDENPWKFLIFLEEDDPCVRDAFSYSLSCSSSSHFFRVAPRHSSWRKRR